MQPTLELIDALYFEEVQAARAASPEEKLLDGPRLFDRMCRAMKDGIRMQHPTACEDEVRIILIHRLEIARKLDQR